MTTAATRLITAEEFAVMPSDPPMELVRGRLVPVNVPTFEHGSVCGNISFELKLFLRSNDLGRVTSNDSGVVTQRDPDSVRGPDVAYWSYDRLPRDVTPKGYPAVVPDLAFEVLSPTDRRSEVLEKIAEYLNAGVSYACLVDPRRQETVVYPQDEPEYHVSADDELKFPDVLPGFAVKVAQFFA